MNVGRGLGQHETPDCGIVQPRRKQHKSGRDNRNLQKASRLSVIWRASEIGGNSMDLKALTDAVLVQRQERMNDSGPALRGIGSARFQVSGSLISVSAAQPRAGKADEMVSRIVRFARERWLAVSWVYLRDRDDPQLLAALRTNSFQARETLRLMGCIGMLHESPFASPEVNVGPIRNIEEMQAYERISSWGFNHQPAPSREHIIMRSRERWDEQQAQWYQYYLGRFKGEPGGGAYVSLWERVPTIYGVVTAPPARGNGVAGRVMTRLVNDTLARGFPWTCLYVALGNPAEQLYSSLGYTFLLEQTTFQWGESRW